MSRRRRGRKIDGWLNIDKPGGPTSTDVVAIVKRATGAAKVGHGGTLDPLASGVLPVALGEATKTVSFAMDREKTYRFTVRWGIGTDTDDAEGTEVTTSAVRPDDPGIRAVLPEFTGEIRQRPPAFSAIKVGGKRAYDLARDGAPPVLEARPVTVHSLELIETGDADRADFRVVCGKGTYVRALARDLARHLGTVGHVTALTREAVGPFALDGAVELDQVAALVRQRRDVGADADAAGDSAGTQEPPWSRWLLPVETPLDDIPAVALSERELFRLRNGQPVGLLRRSDRERLAEIGQAVSAHGDGPGPLVLATDGARAVGLVRFADGELKPVRLLNL